ncbi:Integrase, catalytic core [Gossypium australe]|uniref:Integrase, catalytic core n=1 Tax=Gossypium australe TaxID=47621 RepID=A0A5B6VEJ4_9ROSI|nr:Integrase, catalytic core [Gossypium australe]
MTEKFLLKYFPPARMAKLRNDISSFVQMDLETLYDAWERHKDLLRRCPHHGLPLWLQVQTFYNGVNPSTRRLIDSVTRTKPTKSAGVYNLDAVAMLLT